MDLNDLRALFTVVAFTVFVAIVVWAYGSQRKQRFDEAARLPFTEDEPESGVALDVRIDKGSTP